MAFFAPINNKRMISKYTYEFKENIQLAYPVILGMLGHTLIGIVDKIMVGKLGATELAAVSLGNSFVFIAMSLGIGFSSAITPLVAESFAEEKYQKVRSAFHNGLFLCTVLGLLLFVLIVVSKPVMYAMQQPKEVIDLALPYLDWVAFSLIPVIIYQGYKQFADGLSLTKYSMYAIIGSNVIHVILNYIFIYGFWIFPKMGIQGAALGTVISRIAMVVFLHFIMAKNEQLKIYFQKFHFREINKTMMNKIIGLGLPSALQMLFEVALFTAAIWLCGSIGKTSQAANEIALSIATVTFMFAMGLSVAAMIRVSTQKGLNDIKQLIIVARSVFLLVVLVEIIFAILFMVFNTILPPYFMNMSDAAQFADNAEVIEIASKLLIIAGVFQLFDGIQVVVLGALRGLQDVKIPMYITFVAYWLIGFPISFYLGKYTEWKAIGVWIGLLSGLIAAALFLYIRFHWVSNRLARSHK